MRHVEVLARVRELQPIEVYGIISDFARYPEHSRAVRSVVAMANEDGRATSAWEVNFREGILRWTEEDVFNADERTIVFRQIEGDVEHFAGTWSVRQDPEGSLICFECEFDMGVPGLNDILEPIAEQALCDNARSILKGLIPSIEFVGADRHASGERR